MHHKAVLISVLATLLTFGMFARGHRGPEPLNPGRLPITAPHPIVPPNTVRF